MTTKRQEDYRVGREFISKSSRLWHDDAGEPQFDYYTYKAVITEVKLDGTWARAEYSIVEVYELVQNCPNAREESLVSAGGALNISPTFADEHDLIFLP